MTESTSPGGTADDGAADDGRESSAGLARWQKVVGLIGLVVLVVLVLLLVSSDHGPGRHAPGGSQEQPTDVEGGAGHDPSRSRDR